MANPLIQSKYVQTPDLAEGFGSSQSYSLTIDEMRALLGHEGLTNPPKDVIEFESQLSSDGNTVLKTVAQNLNGKHVYFVITSHKEYDSSDLSRATVVNKSNVMPTNLAGVLVFDAETGADYSTEAFSHHTVGEAVKGARMSGVGHWNYRLTGNNHLGSVADSFLKISSGTDKSVGQEKIFYAYWKILPAALEQDLKKLEDDGIRGPLAMQIASGRLDLPSKKGNGVSTKLNSYMEARSNQKAIQAASVATIKALRNAAFVTPTDETAKLMASWRGSVNEVIGAKMVSYLGKEFEVAVIRFDEASAKLEEMRFNPKQLSGAFMKNSFLGASVYGQNGEDFTSYSLNKSLMDKSGVAISDAIANKQDVVTPFVSFKGLDNGIGTAVDTFYAVENKASSERYFKMGEVYLLVVPIDIQAKAAQYAALKYDPHSAFALALGAVKPAVGQPNITD